jgi:OFA family oxalate/formate antiporter-like MFS transporter
VKRTRGGGAALFFGSLAVFWPGGLIFGLPGALGPHWQSAFGADRAALGQSLFFLLCGAGSCMYLAGRFLGRVGPRRMIAAGALATGLGTALLCAGDGIGSVYAWAYLCGAASSLVYIPVLTVSQIWFPQRRGLVSGFVNMVFGMAAALVAPLAARLLAGLGYGPAVVSLGAATAVMGCLGAGFIRLPSPIPFAPAGEAPAAPPPPSLTVSASLRTQAFWLLWATWAFAGAGGITLVVFASLYGTARGLPLEEAVLLVSAFNVGSGVGRMASGLLSDRLGRVPVMSAAFLAAAAGYALLPNSGGFAAWALCTTAVGYAFGTQFAVSAPLIVDCFGIAAFGAIFGAVFTAYGFLSGILGPWVGGLILDAFQGDFRPVFYYLGALYLVSAACVLSVRPAAGRAGPPGGEAH